MRIRTLLTASIAFLFVYIAPQGWTQQKQATTDELMRRIDALEKKLQVAEDIEAIKQLQNRYVNHLMISIADFQ